MIGLHIALGFLLYIIPFLSKIYGFLIVIIGFLIVLKTSNKNNEVLYISGYIIGAEVLLRMTEGNVLNEFSKYGVILFMVMGMFYSSFSKGSIPYWIYMLLLIPGIIVSTIVLDISTDIRKAIAFNITGPVCLGISAIYAYRRKISLNELSNVLLATALPILSTVCYLFFYTPNVKDVVTGTSSNFETSGGFGPNQVSTILGLGFFIFFARMLLNSSNKKYLLINLFFALVIAFRSIVTFSRGGVITGIVMIIALLTVLYILANIKTRLKLNLIIALTVIGGIGVWTYSSLQTSGLIDKRYANQDAAGRDKTDRLGGREEIASTELQMFLDNPILGIGVGKNKEYREEVTGIKAASHNELTRMLAEHGTLGIFAILILFFTPLVLYVDNKQHFYLLPLFAFWFLTINHAAMRLAAPAFIYALTLLKVYTIEKPVIHRE